MKLGSSGGQYFLVKWLDSILRSYLSGGKSGACLLHSCDVCFPGRYLGTIPKFGPLPERVLCSQMRGMVDRLMTQLLLVNGAVCTGTVVVEVVVVAGAVGAMGAVGVVVTLLVLMFHCIGIVGISTIKCVSFKSAETEVMMVSTVFLNNLSNLPVCFALILLCWCSLILFISKLHSEIFFSWVKFLSLV